MQKVNLNKESIDLDRLASGCHDFLVKVGMEWSHIRVTKNVGTLDLAFFTQDGHIEYTITYHDNRYFGYTAITRKTIEAAPEIHMAQMCLARARRKCSDILRGISLTNF